MDTIFGSDGEKKTTRAYEGVSIKQPGLDYRNASETVCMSAYAARWRRGVAAVFGIGGRVYTCYLASAFPIMKRQRVCDERRIIARKKVAGYRNDSDIQEAMNIGTGAGAVG